MYIGKYRLRKTLLYKCLKSRVSRDASIHNMANGSKHGCNLDLSTFMIFINHSAANYVGKSLFW